MVDTTGVDDEEEEAEEEHDQTPGDGDTERARHRAEELEQVLEIVRGENEALEGRVTTLEVCCEREVWTAVEVKLQPVV